ncbi:hypothetical protein D9757_001061 [Collybiopsis confluens]|uniref:Methyltransferase domain-containing protein n=1 Tax=Collybiopsis confluens TaxID=2823264 RepID=A0A8H5I0R4_9AGAR|nr:hypothetical protein D9757_001061 [Collybiopsis confluens]
MLQLGPVPSVSTMNGGESGERYYASDKYLLPADKKETARLEVQHRVFSKAFENRLSQLPVKLKSGDQVLESAAGTGIWTLEFLEETRKDGVTLNIQCIDISDKQFPKEHPPEIHFSLQSVTDLPSKWNERFSYAHQRLLVLALDKSLWRKAARELFRVLKPGGWLELVEIELQSYQLCFGPCSSKVQSLVLKMYPEKGVLIDLAQHLPSILEESGFVDVQCGMRKTLVGSGEYGYSSSELANFFRSLKRDVVSGGGYGFVGSEEEYEEILHGAQSEWENHSEEGSITLFTILARKP